MTERHLFKRTLTTKNGKKITAWYYWYWKDGKQVRRSCGQRGKPCLTKRDAQAFLAALPDDEERHAVPTLYEACRGMYDDNSEFIRRMNIKGHVMSKNTLYSKRLYFNKILEQFGDISINKIRPADYDRWMISLDLANSSRNNVVTVLRDMYSDMYYRGLIDTIPHIDRYSTHDIRAKGILTIEEIQSLFPKDVDELVSIWTLWKHNDYDAIQFATMILMLFTTGMRSGEIRALQSHQRIQRNVLLLNAMMNSDRKRVDYLKKGTRADKKWRVAIMPERTVEMLDYLESLPERRNKQTDYLFEHLGKPVETYYLVTRFKKTLRKIGIDPVARNISTHSTRFTYNSIMRREISEDSLRLMLGHASQYMTDYYDKSTVMDNLPALLENKGTINAVWEL